MENRNSLQPIRTAAPADRLLGRVCSVGGRRYLDCGFDQLIAVSDDPNSQMAFWFSMIPFTSPVVMMARIPYGIPLWEVILSLAILYASFTAMVWLAAKIYRVGIFMYGKKPTFKELYKWIRYKY